VENSEFPKITTDKGFMWIDPSSEPPAVPGNYRLRFDHKIETEKNTYKRVWCTFGQGNWDGENWTEGEEPNYYQPWFVPAKRRRRVEATGEVTEEEEE
jgi:hypothetical protein